MHLTKFLIISIILSFAVPYQAKGLVLDSQPSSYQSIETGVNIEVSGKKLQVYSHHTRHPDKADSLINNYVRVFTDETLLNVKVSLPEKPIDAAIIRSAGKEYKPNIVGGSLQFTIPGEGIYYLDINPYSKTIYLFVDKYSGLPSNTLNVVNYNILSNSSDLQTTKIQNLINTAPAGSTIYFPKGVYRTGTLKIRRSDLSIFLDVGAYILGSDNPKDYDGALLYIDKSSNISLYGYGVIDANGMVTYGKDSSGEEVKIRGINIFDSQNIKLNGLVLQNSNSWGVHAYRTSGVSINNFKVFSGKDGIDPDSSTNFTAEKMFIESIDDSVAVKSRDSTKPTNNILIKDSVVRSIGATALKVGTENRSNISNVSFINCDVLYSDRGLHVLLREGGVVGKVTYKGIRVFNTAGLPIFIDKPTGGSGGGSVSNIQFEDIEVHTNSNILFSTIKTSLLYGRVVGLTAIVSKPDEGFNSLIDTDNYNNIDLSDVKIYWLGNKSYYKDTIGGGFKSVVGVQEFITESPPKTFENIIINKPDNIYDVNNDGVFNILDVIQLIKIIFA